MKSLCTKIQKSLCIEIGRKVNSGGGEGQVALEVQKTRTDASSQGCCGLEHEANAHR